MGGMVAPWFRTRGSVLIDRGDKQTVENLEQHQGDDRRDIEHPERRDDPPDRPDDRFRHIVEQPADGGAHSRIEPGEQRPPNQGKRQYRKDQIDNASQIVQPHIPDSTDRRTPSSRTPTYSWLLSIR